MMMQVSDRWRQRLARSGALAAGAALLVSFGGFASVGAEASAGPSTITLSEGVQVQPNWWFPIAPGQYCSVENGVFSSMAYRPLIWISNTDTLDWGQSIATGVKASDNDTVFTLTIGNRYKWSNGQVVNAYDALYGGELLLATSEPKADWTQCGEGIGGWPSEIKSFSAPNAHTLVVTTKGPVNPIWFEHNGLGQIIPIPKTVWDHSANWTTEEKWILQVGTKVTAPEFKVVDGPYMYGPFANNAYATLVKNPAYTGPDPAHIKTIRFLYETSEANLWAAALRGTFAQVAIPSQYNSQRQVLASRAHMSLEVAPYGFCFNYIQPDLNNQAPQAKLLQQLYIRQAMQMAINQPQMIKLNGGLGYAVDGPIPSVPRTQYWDPVAAKRAYPYDPAAGKKLLEEHGWVEKNGVMTNKAGQTLSFSMLYLSGSQWVEDSVQLWQADLKQEGIKLSLQPELFNQMLATVDNTHKWEIAWWGGGWCYEPDYYPTGAGLFEPGSSANSGDFNSAQLNALIQDTHKAASAQQLQVWMDEYQVLAERLLPDWWVPNAGAYQATATWLNAPNSAFNPVLAETQYNLWSVK
jgi:peptide/nickel transport system substrate-binding protein